MRVKMVFRDNLFPRTIGLQVGLLLASLPFVCMSQAPAPTTAAAPAASQRGTVKSISGSALSIATDAGQAIDVTVASGARIVQLPVGSTDLKTATPGQLSDITAGDRVLITGKAGDTPATFTAIRVIVMKSADIAQKQAADQADWKARGTGGIVSAVDPASGAITVTSGTKKVVINTTAKTVFRRSASDSVQYQDAKPGTLAQIHVKDQLQARGTKSADDMSMTAEEVVSGSFLNLSGVLLSVDASKGVITLKDLMSKRLLTVDLTAKAEIHKMPLQMAANFAARASGGGQGSGGRRAGGSGQDAGGAAGGGQAGPGGGMRRNAGADLSQMMERLPLITVADLQKGDAVMIVASEPTPGASTVTAITVLSGVDPILTANPNGGMDLSMNLGGGGAGE